MYARTITQFLASDATPFRTLKAFLANGTAQEPSNFYVYSVSGCKTEIEIPEAIPDYERIDVTQALALLRELPDLRLVRRLQLSDSRSFMDPWARKSLDEKTFHLGHATNFSLVVLYKPDRRLGEFLGAVLLHEWLHLVAFASWVQLWRFKRANAIEPLQSAGFLNPEGLGSASHEAWCDLGEILFGYDESKARQAGLAWPVHAIIIWRCIERKLRAAPLRFRSSRFDELMQRGRFMNSVVAAKARAIRVGQA